MHNGVDLAAHYEKTFSMFPDEVIGVGQDYRSEKYVTVRTDGYTISYCHLSSFGVTKGMFVNAGDALGLSGNSGISTDPHLHVATKRMARCLTLSSFWNMFVTFLEVLYRFPIRRMKYSISSVS